MLLYFTLLYLTPLVISITTRVGHIRQNFNIFEV